MINKCPHHDLPPWYVFHIFYGGLNQDNKKELDLASGGAFMEFTVTQAWELLERIRRKRETWGFDLGGEGGIEVEYDCLNAYKETGKVKETADEFHLDDDYFTNSSVFFRAH